MKDTTMMSLFDYLGRPAGDALGQQVARGATGHKHPGQEEVYHFISGEGFIKLDEEILTVRPGSIVLIPDGAFHKVFNTGLEDLVFVCVFDGKRNH